MFYRLSFEASESILSHTLTPNSEHRCVMMCVPPSRFLLIVFLKSTLSAVVKGGNLPFLLTKGPANLGFVPRSCGSMPMVTVSKGRCECNYQKEGHHTSFGRFCCTKMAKFVKTSLDKRQLEFEDEKEIHLDQTSNFGVPC